VFRGGGRAGHGLGRGGYCLFFKPAPPYAGLDFLTRDLPKRPKNCAGIRYAGQVKTVRVLRVCGSGFILMAILVILFIWIGFSSLLIGPSPKDQKYMGFFLLFIFISHINNGLFFLCFVFVKIFIKIMSVLIV
jgi:hypothetical protein